MLEGLKEEHGLRDDKIELYQASPSHTAPAKSSLSNSTRHALVQMATIEEHASCPMRQPQTYLNGDDLPDRVRFSILEKTFLVPVTAGHSLITANAMKFEK